MREISENSKLRSPDNFRTIRTLEGIVRLTLKVRQYKFLAHESVMKNAGKVFALQQPIQPGLKVVIDLYTNFRTSLVELDIVLRLNVRTLRKLETKS